MKISQKQDSQTASRQFRTFGIKKHIGQLTKQMTLLTVIFCSCGFISAAETFNEFEMYGIGFPYRYVSDKHYNIEPIMKYARQVVHRKTIWESFKKPTGYEDWEYFGNEWKVQQILDNGMLISYADGSGFTFIKVNKIANLKDGDRVTFIAMKTGTYVYTSVLGVRKTIAAYDVGICYDPKKMGKDGKSLLLPNIVMVRVGY